MRWILRGLGICAVIVLAFFLFGYVTMYLWNWLVVYLFHLPAIDFKMAIGLVVLSKLLFGGIKMNHSGGGGWGKRKMWKAKWESMSEDDRNKFQSEFAERCKMKWGKKMDC